MKKIVALNTTELNLVQQVKELVSLINNNLQIQSIEKNTVALNDLAESISFYPSILAEQKIGKSHRSIITLIDNLCVDDFFDLELRIPTKAILGKTFTISKVNFFFALLYHCKEFDGIGNNNGTQANELADKILDLIKNLIFSIMAEEVFLSLISDREIAMDIRNSAAYLIANIWEYRIDHEIKEFVPILTNIWNIKKGMTPTYGTMLGLSELLKMSHKTDTVWLDFLQRDELSENEIKSLQEFLMELSFEEMNLISEKMEKTGKNIINMDDVKTLLGKNKPNSAYSKTPYLSLVDDPRAFLKSYRIRKNNAILRSYSNRIGPKKTLEDYLMIYLISQPKYWSKFAML